ncbi:hypothetical protein [Marinilactibacillus psychrotolerans]|uniref:hypothetical protein n=1 Tax=Marinilactibacillus psychrotolerans TaxID=191770 RepID=UPI000B35C4D3|nr:hypothetical protein [Marinilactibacillus psychrotolerans]
MEFVKTGGRGSEFCFRTTTTTNKLTVMKDMVNYIYKNKIDNYADFLMLCIEESDDWFDVAVNSNTLALNKMIDAMWQKNQAMNTKIWLCMKSECFLICSIFSG